MTWSKNDRFQRRLLKKNCCFTPGQLRNWTTSGPKSTAPFHQRCQDVLLFVLLREFFALVRKAAFNHFAATLPVFAGCKSLEGIQGAGERGSARAARDHMKMIG